MKVDYHYVNKLVFICTPWSHIIYSEKRSIQGYTLLKGLSEVLTKLFNLFVTSRKPLYRTNVSKNCLTPKSVIEARYDPHPNRLTGT